MANVSGHFGRPNITMVSADCTIGEQEDRADEPRLHNCGIDLSAAGTWFQLISLHHGDHWHIRRLSVPFFAARWIIAGAASDRTIRMTTKCAVGKNGRTP